VTTEKDAARLAMHREALAQWNIRIAVLPIVIRFVEQESAFNNAVNGYIMREREEMDQWQNGNA